MAKLQSNKHHSKKEQLFYGSRLSLSIYRKLLDPTVDIISHKDGSIITKTNLSNSDLDLLLLLTKYQNNSGVIENVNFKKICSELNMAASTFFYCLEHLEERNYIRRRLTYKGFWQITIVDNYWLTKDDLSQKPYLDTNQKFLFTKEFRNLKLNAKKICLYLLNQPMIQNFRTFNIYLDEIKNKIGVKTSSLVKKYLTSIEQFFPYIFVKGKHETLKIIDEVTAEETEKKYKIDKVKFKASAVVREGEISQKTVYVKNYVQAICKRFNIPFENFKDLMEVINQYTWKINFNKLLSIVKLNILHNKMINPKYINMEIGSS